MVIDLIDLYKKVFSANSGANKQKESLKKYGRLFKVSMMMGEVLPEQKPEVEKPKDENAAIDIEVLDKKRKTINNAPYRILFEDPIEGTVEWVKYVTQKQALAFRAFLKKEGVSEVLVIPGVKEA